MREGAAFKTTAGAKGRVGSRAWAAGDTVGYSFGEEVANAVTHGLAAALSIVGLVVLVMSSLWHDRNTVVVASAAVFGASMIVLYLISTLYHALPQPGAKRVLRVLDHSAIYLLIAGTYTPFCLVTLGGTRGTVLCAIVWTIGLAGAFLQPLLIRIADWINCILYLALGWCVIFVIKPLIEALPPAGLWLLAGGGIAYSAGVIFYLWEKLPYNHAIWHLFVLAGTALQFFAVLFFVIPAN